MDEIERRLQFAKTAAVEAGRLGRSYFARIEELTIISKGHQDMVSEADRNLETLLREAIAANFPGDGIVGEEHGTASGTSKYTWVLDPIDGTANFVNGIPAWCVVVACVTPDQTVVGVIHDPNAGETFWSAKGQGAFVNDRPIWTSPSRTLSSGSVGVGISNRTPWQPTAALIGTLLEAGGLYFRNASGALMLAYVAAGRLIAYCEEHMNAWDCVAGLLLVREAGGITNAVPMEEMLQHGGRVVAATSAIYPLLERLTDQAFGADA